MATNGGPNIIEDGLVFAVDAANKKSYPGSGTTWNGLAGSNDGTLTNGPTFDSGNGGSIVFDGTNDYVDFGEIGTSIPSYFTWEVIVKPLSFTETLRLMWTRNGGGCWMNLNSNSANFTIGTIQDYSINGTFNVGDIYILTYVIDNDQWKMYVNGGLLGSTYITTTRTQSDNVYVSGVVLNSNGTIRSTNHSNQSMYNIKYYNRALTPQEVPQNYNALKSRFGL